MYIDNQCVYFDFVYLLQVPIMKNLYKDILVGLMFIVGIASIIFGEFMVSLVLFVTADIVRGSKSNSIENNIA